MISIDPTIFTFIQPATGLATGLMQSLSLIGKLYEERSIRGDVSVVAIYVDSNSRLYRQGEPPKVLQRIQALEICSEGGPYEGTMYLRFGSDRETDLFDTIEELQEDEEARAAEEAAAR